MANKSPWAQPRADSVEWNLVYPEKSCMIEKPDIKDENIILALKQIYSIQANHIEFLPIGNDASAFSYRVETKDGTLYFVKIRTKPSNLAALVIPRFLKENGVEQVVAPLPTQSQKLSGEMGEFSIILYPFVMGNEAMEVGMTNSQWTEFGSTLKRIHTTSLTDTILRFVEQESFIPKWGRLVKTLHQQVYAQNDHDPYQKQLARIWKEKNEIIQTVIERTERLGKYLRQADLEFFLCHADIHTANLLITPEQNMFIVDWDGALLAPKERDLMFVLDADTIRTREEQMFFNGYGNVKINKLALAYYRYEWCVQEIGDYGERIFFAKDLGESTRQGALEEFIKLFSPGEVIEAALNSSVET